MNKQLILSHIREVLGLNIGDIANAIYSSENHIMDIENGVDLIPNKLLIFYSKKLNIDYSIIKVLFRDFDKDHNILDFFQNITLTFILKYLELGKWMSTFDGTKKK